MDANRGVQNFVFPHKRQMKPYYSRFDPFDRNETSDKEFKKHYRFKEDSVKLLVALMKDIIEPKVCTNNAYSGEQRLCMVLREFGSNGFQALVGSAVKFSQPSVSRHIYTVLRGIEAVERSLGLVRFNTDPAVLTEIVAGFYDFKGFPYVAGCIDGTQIKIAKPIDNADQYVNRNGNFAINTQVVVNHRGAFTNVVARWPGSIHDSRMLTESIFHDHLLTGCLGKYFLLGDAGYPCTTFMMTPFRGQTTDRQSEYNKIHSKTRCKVECVIGMWKNKFPILQQTMRYDPETCCRIIKATATLWNFGIVLGDFTGYDPDTQVDPEEDDWDILLDDTPTGLVTRELIADQLWAEKQARGRRRQRYD